ncbi:hypothetical protein C3942_14710 [Solimonas fluminis]|uniref:Uncharacterized protein n=1 Tax=Solimonas fluminis TaxID=2086571 RepID=A0A2S5TDK1_9GAMM|nr:hypothetical protein C3942_14710 [Solimonas fluminis]
MGLDFIRKRAGSFKKAWLRGSEELARNDLLTRHPECQSRTVVADLGDECGASVGQRVVLEAAGGRLLLYRGHARIGAIARPPADLASAIASNGGVALGEITQLNHFSGTADVCVLR